MNNCHHHTNYSRGTKITHLTLYLELWLDGSQICHLHRRTYWLVIWPVMCSSSQMSRVAGILSSLRSCGRTIVITYEWHLLKANHSPVNSLDVIAYVYNINKCNFMVVYRHVKQLRLAIKAFVFLWYIWNWFSFEYIFLKRIFTHLLLLWKFFLVTLVSPVDRSMEERQGFNKTIRSCYPVWRVVECCCHLQAPVDNDL